MSKLIRSHPVADSFVLAAKGASLLESFPLADLTASTLVSRVARWLREWTQRDIVPGDELLGLRQPSFTALVNDIYVFQCVACCVYKPR